MEKTFKIYKKDLNLFEYTHIRYVGTVNKDITVKDIKNPEFWIYVHDMFRENKTRIYKGAEVTLYTEDMSKRFDLVFLGFNINKEVKFKLLHEYDLTNEKNYFKKKNDEYIGVHIPHKGWRILRKSDNHIVHEKLSKDDKNKFLSEMNG